MDVAGAVLSEPGCRRYSGGGWGGLIREDFVSSLGGREPLELAAGAEVVRERASSTVYRVRAGAGDGAGGLYVKVVRALSDRAAERPGLVDRLKWTVRPSKAMQALRVARRMRRAGIGSADVLLAVRRWGKGSGGRLGGIVDLTVTRRVEGGSLWDEASGAGESRRDRLAAEAGATMARLHGAHIMHGDCTPQNLIVVADDHLVFVDNDRTRGWPGWLPFVFARRNVAQMTLRFRRIDERVVDAFVDAYAAERGMGAGARERLRAFAARKNMKRRAAEGR